MPPVLPLSVLRTWSSAEGVRAGLRRIFVDQVIVLPETLGEAEISVIVELLVLFLELPFRVVATKEEARDGELTVVLTKVSSMPGPSRGGAILCVTPRAPGERRLGATLALRDLRDAVIQLMGRQHSGTRLVRAAQWASTVTDSPRTAIAFAEGVLGVMIEDKLASEAQCLAAGIASVIAVMLRGVDTRVASWVLAIATGDPHPGRFVGREALVLGQTAAIRSAFGLGLVEEFVAEDGDREELRKPLEAIRHLDDLPVPLSREDIAAALGSRLDPAVAEVLRRWTSPDKKPLGLRGPKVAPTFVGREAIIERLIALSEPSSSVQTTILRGPPGSGRTQIAAAVCEALSPRLEPVWLRFSGGPERVYRALAQALDVPMSTPEMAALDSEGVPSWARKTQEILAFRSCLLVVHDVDALREEELAAWLPSGPGTSSVLVVSEGSQRLLRSKRDAVVVEVPALDKAEARRLLSRHVPSLADAIDRGDADPLIARAKGLPGELVLVAALLEKRGIGDVLAWGAAPPMSVRGALDSVVEQLGAGEKLILRAILAGARDGSTSDLVLAIAGAERRSDLDGLVTRGLVQVSNGVVSLGESARLVIELKLGSHREDRARVERIHAAMVLDLHKAAKKRGDERAMVALSPDLALAAERGARWCKEGDLAFLPALLDITRELLWTDSGDKAERAALAVKAYEAARVVAPGRTDIAAELSNAEAKLGDARRERGDTAGALEAYERARDVRAPTLVVRGEADIVSHYNASVIHDKMGDVLFARGDLEGALAAYREGLSIRAKLAESAPEAQSFSRSLVSSLHKIGDVLLAMGDAEGAFTVFRDALDRCQSLLKETTCHPMLAVSHEKLGDAHLALEQVDEATRAYQASLTIYQSLVAMAVENTEWQRGLAASHRKVGRVLVSRGALDEALRHYERAYARLKSIATDNPLVTEYQRDVAVCEQDLGDVSMARGDRAGARSRYEAALAVFDRLSRLDPANVVWQADTARASAQLASVCADDQAGREEKRALLERAERILRRLSAAGKLNAEQQSRLREVERELSALPSPA